MLNDAKDLQAVYIVCGYTDLRKGIDSLSNSTFRLNILWIKYSCQNDFIHGFKKLSHISLHAFMFYDSVVL